MAPFLQQPSGEEPHLKAGEMSGEAGLNPSKQRRKLDSHPDQANPSAVGQRGLLCPRYQKMLVATATWQARTKTNLLDFRGSKQRNGSVQNLRAAWMCAGCLASQPRRGIQQESCRHLGGSCLFDLEVL